VSSDAGAPDAPRVLPGREFVRALEWAAALHADQRRKGGDAPYVAHLLAVAAVVLEDGGSEREAIAALLHDSIEDAGVTPKQIRRRFGRKVARIVVACTDVPVGPAKHEKHRKHGKHGKAGKEGRRARRDASTWRARKELSLAHLRDPATGPRARRVRAADALCNARAIVADLRRIGPETWLRFNAGAVDQLWYYRSLSLELTACHPGPVTDELRATVREMEQLAGWWFDVGDPQPGPRS